MCILRFNSIRCENLRNVNSMKSKFKRLCETSIQTIESIGFGKTFDTICDRLSVATVQRASSFYIIMAFIEMKILKQNNLCANEWVSLHTATEIRNLIVEFDRRYFHINLFHMQPKSMRCSRFDGSKSKLLFGPFPVPTKWNQKKKFCASKNVPVHVIQFITLTRFFKSAQWDRRFFNKIIRAKNVNSMEFERNIWGRRKWRWR